MLVPSRDLAAKHYVSVCNVGNVVGATASCGVKTLHRLLARSAAEHPTRTALPMQAEHDGKPFFPKLVDFLTSGAVVVSWAQLGRSAGCSSTGAASMHAQACERCHTGSCPPLRHSAYKRRLSSPYCHQAMVFEGKDVVKTGALRPS